MRFRTNNLFIFVLALIILLALYELQGNDTRKGPSTSDLSQKARHIQEELMESQNELDRVVRALAVKRKDVDEAEIKLGKLRREHLQLETNIEELNIKQLSMQSKISRNEQEMEKREAANAAAALHSQANNAQAQEEEGDANNNNEDEMTDQELDQAAFKNHGFNEFISDKIPYNRSVPDVRIPECRDLKHDIRQLPKTSVIICFVEESFHVLLRSVWSVINRSPPSLLHEIILIDDYSNAPWLGQKLIDYVENTWKGLVRLIRAPRRLGLIRARLLGAEHATGEVLTFLDSHIEANVEWLPPILEIIARNKTTVVTPIIDTIDDRTIAYSSEISDPPAVGTFSWDLEFNWMPGKYKPGQKKTDPIDSPTMAGGLFSIDRSYFYEIGAYDSSMDGWGGENIEMSFRIWQCGGTLVTAPCSHVGHIFRSRAPYKVPEEETLKIDTFTRNTVRLVEVWMDEYKENYYLVSPDAKKVDYGDVSERVNFRREHRCQSFGWFLDHVMPGHLVPDAKHLFNIGALSSHDGNCIDKMGGRSSGTVGVYPCHGGTVQRFMHTRTGQLRTGDDACLGASGSPSPTMEVVLRSCEDYLTPETGGVFEYDDSKKSMVHVESRGCLEEVTNEGNRVLRVMPCDITKSSQQWSWKGSPFTRA